MPRQGGTLPYRDRQLARQKASANRREISIEVDAVLHYIDAEAERLSKKFKRSVAWFHHQFYQGGRIVRQKRSVNIYNAAQQVEAFLDGRKGVISDEEKAKFTEIQAKLVQLNGPESASRLPDDLKDFLREKVQAWRDAKHTGARASTRAVVQDVNHTLKRVSDELLALSARTDVQTILFAVKGKPEHPVEGLVTTSEKGGRYLLHGMKKHSLDILKEFEAYVLGDIEGLVLNHNGRLAELKSKIRNEIREGLVHITGDPKAMMQYDRYEKLIVVEKGVKLINWPEDVPFVNASDISSFQELRRLFAVLTDKDFEKRCHWVKLSEQEWEARKEAFYDAEAQDPVPRKRKARAQPDPNSDLSGSDREETEDARPTKRPRGASARGKENDASAASVKKTARKNANKAARAVRKGITRGKDRAVKPNKARKAAVCSSAARKNTTLGEAN